LTEIARNTSNSKEMSRENSTAAIAYLRTSSPTNVGPDKDSDKRRRDAIHAFAKRAGLDLVGEFYDAGVKGADPIEGRPAKTGIIGGK
jgi:DNA invertase Pin-like site-specific DNA recombinase